MMEMEDHCFSRLHSLLRRRLTEHGLRGSSLG
jgi:hypothetical protein